MLSLKGILPPVLTPFTADGSLDLDAFEANLDALSGFEFAGCLVLGSNGEAGSLDEAEKLSLVRAARRCLPGRTLLAGTGLESTRGTTLLTRKAADAGADGALVLTPGFYKSQMGAEALRRHFEAVAEASPVPVLVYSVPQFTGIPLPPLLPRDLARHPNLVGIKESSGDIGLMGRLLGSVPASFSVLCGSAPVLYPALCMGAAGGILAVANCAPAATLGIYSAFQAGDHERARRLQRALTPLAVAVTATHGVAGLKAAASLAGMRGGSVRGPLLPAPDSVREELRGLLHALQDVP